MLSFDLLPSFGVPVCAMVLSTYALVRVRRQGRNVSRALRRAGRRGQYKLLPIALLADEATCQALFRSLDQKGDQAEPEPAPAQRTRFFIDSLVLLNSFRHVCPPNAAGPFKEVFHYSSGLQVDPHTFVISHLLPLDFAQQSAGGVRVADSSNIETLTYLDEIGLPLTAHFHSHPGHGRDANHPSGTDHRFQERLERGGHICIGGIFSRDGHLRFFAGDPDRFEVIVQGKHVKKVAENVYKLSLDDSLVPITSPARR